jgi:hypothetical protein
LTFNADLLLFRMENNHQIKVNIHRKHLIKQIYRAFNLNALALVETTKLADPTQLNDVWFTIKELKFDMEKIRVDSEIEVTIDSNSAPRFFLKID